MEREYYLLDEAASRVGYKASDLVHFGAIGKLKIFVLMPGCSATEHIWDDDPEENEFACEQRDLEESPANVKLLGPQQLPRSILREMEAGIDPVLNHVYDPDTKNKLLPTIWNLNFPVEISELRLVIFADELNRLTHKPDSVDQKNTDAEFSEKPLGKRERETLLTIIAALAKENRLDVSMTSKTAGLIENMTELVGARVAARTIEEHLKLIPATLENRGMTKP